MPAGTTGLGWTANSDPIAIGILEYDVLPGRKVALRSSTATIQQYLIHELNKIEPCTQAIYGYDYRTNVNNPLSLSEHSAGTAFDYNAVRHPNGKRGTWGANEGRVDTLLASITMAAKTQVFRWGEHYQFIPDGMHFEVISQAAADAAVKALNLDINGNPKEPTVAATTYPFTATYNGVVWLIKGDTKVQVLTHADWDDLKKNGVLDIGPVGSRFLTYWPIGETGF